MCMKIPNSIEVYTHHEEVIAYSKIRGWGILVTGNGSYYKVGAKYMVWVFRVDLIDGKTPQEIDRMKEEWRSKYTRDADRSIPVPPYPIRATSCSRVHASASYFARGWCEEYQKEIEKASQWEDK